MSAVVEEPASIRELTRYVERELPNLKTLLNDQHEQLVVVGQPGAKPPIGLWEILGGNSFEMQVKTTDSRGRWMGVTNAADAQ